MPTGRHFLPPIHNRLEDSARDHLRRFAFRVAGPRDFAINLAINGTIAWWVFGGRTAIPLTGSESIFVMLLPMAFIESTLTTFFGLLDRTVELRKLDSTLEPTRRWNWFVAAASHSLLWGIIGLMLAFVVRFALQRAVPAVVLSPRTVVFVIGLSSGVLAYVMHVRAVVRSRWV